MKFLQEINESRLYKRLIQVNGKSVDDIAERLFEHMLALQIFANENPRLAARYARNVMKMESFTGFRTSQSDLYNLITLVLKQEQYSHLLDTDSSVGLPELRLRRNLRELARGEFNNNDYSALMLMMQNRFKKLPGILVVLRRRISGWKSLSPGDKKATIRTLLIAMRERGIQSEFYVHLQKMID